MFQRIIHESWVNIVPMLAFGIMFTVFVLTTIRALRLAPAERERLAALPLAPTANPDADE
jgi:hypothetical protein